MHNSTHCSSPATPLVQAAFLPPISCAPFDLKSLTGQECEDSPYCLHLVSLFHQTLDDSRFGGIDGFGELQPPSSPSSTVRNDWSCSNTQLQEGCRFPRLSVREI